MKKVNIELTYDEAFVLFEFLANFNKTDFKFEDQAEQRVLWNIECDLEKAIDEIFSENYKEVLQKARDTVRDKD